MAQNISLWGATYSAVPSVTLPKQGGGTASFTDVSDTTATASDVSNTKYFYTSAGVRTQGTNSGGGGSSKACYVHMGLASRKANSYGATDAKVTVAKAGTYTISYVAVRGSSSGAPKPAGMGYGNAEECDVEGRIPRCVHVQRSDTESRERGGSTVAYCGGKSGIRKGGFPIASLNLFGRFPASMISINVRKIILWLIKKMKCFRSTCATGRYG